MLYDADCGFCTRAARLVPRLGMRVDVAPLQSCDLASLGIDAVRSGREMPFLAADGSVSYGHRAWAGVLMTGPAPLRWLGRVLGSRAAAPWAARTYRQVAENRHRLPGGTPTCSLADRPTSPTSDLP